MAASPPPVHPARRAARGAARRPAGVLAAGLAALWTATLAACGGGIYIGWGGDDDRPPQVQLVTSTGLAAPGQTLTLVAAASDDYGVERVQFFRLDSNGAAEALGSDFSPPYQLDTVMPATSASSVRYFARAWDEGDQANDSNIVSVTVLR